MTDGSIWVGLLDLDDGQPVAAVSVPLAECHGQARILVRKHGAPLGYVTLPAQPEATLTERARGAAEMDLADAVRQHDQWDSSAGPAARTRGRRRWPAPAGSRTWTIPG